jgi:hypothetical protein
MSFSLIQASSFCSASILCTKVSRSPSLAFATPCRSRQLEASIRVCSAVRTSEYSQTGATTSSSGSLELVSTQDVAETEVADRQRLFNRIAPMYDSVSLFYLICSLSLSLSLSVRVCHTQRDRPREVTETPNIVVDRGKRSTEEGFEFSEFKETTSTWSSIYGLLFDVCDVEGILVLF